MIGDGRTCALVCADGSIDWLRLAEHRLAVGLRAAARPRRRLRSGSSPPVPFEAERAYETGTNVLADALHDGRRRRAGGRRADADRDAGSSPLRELVRAGRVRVGPGADARGASSRGSTTAALTPKLHAARRRRVRLRAAPLARAALLGRRDAAPRGGGRRRASSPRSRGDRRCSRSARRYSEPHVLSPRRAVEERLDRHARLLGAVERPVDLRRPVPRRGRAERARR